MPLPTINDVAKIVIKGHIGNHPMENVLHCGVTTPIDQAAAQAACDELAGYFTPILPDLNASAGFDRMSVYDLSGSGHVFDILPATWPVVGTGTTGALPPSTAGVISLQTTLGGRAGRGRIYVGGWDEDASDGDSMDTAAFGHLQTVAASIVSGGLVGVLSYYSGTDKTQVNRRNVPILRASPQFSMVANATAKRTWANQRRRSDIR